VVVGDDVTSAAGLALAFAGGLALFLLGMDGVTGALRGLAGSTLRRWLDRLTATRLRGVAAGVLVAATIQSSSVTVVLVLGFLSAGLLTLPAAVPVIIGANVGTTVTAQIVAFDVIGAALGMVAIGTALRLASRREVCGSSAPGWRASGCCSSAWG
jgi:phosphate:Na+ symporter